MNGNLDYDFDEVIQFCQSSASRGIVSLVDDLNNLCEELEECQDKFHCKGGDSANAVIKIYKGFAATIGKANGIDNIKSASGLAALGSYSAMIFNTCYAEAIQDKKRLEDISGMNW